MQHTPGLEQQLYGQYQHPDELLGRKLCGLQECLEPYLRMVHEVCKRGEKTAKVNYGCRGFAATTMWICGAKRLLS